MREVDADIVFLQEASRDARLDEKWANQVEEINEALGYRFTAYEPEAQMRHWYGKPVDWEMTYGQGFLSRFELKDVEMVLLPRVTRDRDFGFLRARVWIEGADVQLLNVHFENTSEGSKAHLVKTLSMVSGRAIIAGDFNMYDTSVLEKFAGKDYEISYFVSPYESYMPNEHSHNDEPITLDYVIASRDAFQMTMVACIDAGVSDHRPVLVELEVL